MRSATAGACGSSRRTPGQDCRPHAVFFVGLSNRDYRTGIIEHAVSNRRGLWLKPPHPPAKIASRMQFFYVGLFLCRIIKPGLSNMRSATAGACGSSRRTPRPRLLPACSFFSGEKKGRAFGAVDVVLQGPQILILSSGGTTSLSPSVRPHLRIGFNMFPAAGYRNC